MALHGWIASDMKSGAVSRLHLSVPPFSPLHGRMLRIPALPLPSFPLSKAQTRPSSLRFRSVVADGIIGLSSGAYGLQAHQKARGFRLLQIDLRQQDEDIPFIDRLSVIHGVSPGWMPSLAAQAAGIRSLFLKPSSRLSTSGKAFGCKVRLRLVFPCCPLSPLRKCAPLALRHCGRRLADRNRSVSHSAPCNVGPGCSVQTLPCVCDCAKPARPAAAPPCLLAPEVDCMSRLEVKFLHILLEFSGQIGLAIFPETSVESEVFSTQTFCE